MRRDFELTRGAPVWLASLLTFACGDDEARPSTSTSVAGSSTSAPATSTGSADGDTAPQPRTETGDPPGTTSGDSTGGAMDTTGTDSTGAAARCAPDHVCLFVDGDFFTATEGEPKTHWDVELPEGAEYSVVEVEVDFTHGGWFPDDPAGLHNVFWLHRGTRDDFTWLGGVLGYVNLRGPGTNIVRTRHDLDVADLMQSQTFNVGGVMPVQGETYHVLYRYDAVGGEVLVRLTHGDEVIAEGTDVPTTDLVRNTEGAFFIQFANPTDVSAPGPEVPSLGWVFSDLRLEFIP